MVVFQCFCRLLCGSSILSRLFTVVLLAIGIPLRQGREGRDADIGSLLVGFGGSWLAGCLLGSAASRAASAH